MALTTGAQVGPYEIISPVGAGGMGEVYKAHDTRLDRDVAIKVLPNSFSSDADRLRRFEQEARSASQLDHPNIVVIHDFGTHQGAPYVVQELLKGESLGQRLREGPLPLRQAMKYALEMARGLAAAHKAGIVHRDLKPDNIFLTEDGRVKILDFGLAKLMANDATPGQHSSAPTANVGTHPGMVMGTVGYMSPEQVRAKPADARSDIFSLGVILYEMVAASRAFDRESTAETMTAIVREDPPDLSATGPSIPPGLERVIHHCLEKNPEQRFQSADDLAFALSALSGTETAIGLPAVKAARSPAWLPWAAAGALGAAVLAVVLLFLLRPSAPAERRQFAIPVDSEVLNLSLSAAGQMLVYVAHDDTSGENMLFYEPLGAELATRMPGTEGASYPFWSPDSAYVGFFADGQLKKAPVSGGMPQVVTRASYGRGGSWSRKGVIIYSPEAGGPLWRVNADGGNPAPLTDKIFAAGEISHRWPVFLPDGDHFLFWAGSFGANQDPEKTGIYRSSLAAKEKVFVQKATSNAAYSNGHLYFVDQRHLLLASPFDAASSKAGSEQMVVSDRVAFQPSVYWGTFGVGGNDTVVYSSSGIGLSVLTWYDRTGKELGRLGEPGVLANPSLSPDGELAAVDVTDVKTAKVDLWMESIRPGTNTRFSFEAVEEVSGTWSPDGTQVAYRSISTGAVQILIKKKTGLNAPRVLYSAPGSDDIIPTSWSPDGSGILASYQPADGGSNLVIVDAVAGKLTPFAKTKASETNGQISPDGKWAIYASNESGVWEIYATAFPSGQGKWQVSQNGGTEPRWRGDGKEIYYVDPKGMLTAVPVSTGDSFSAGAASPLFTFHGRAPVSSTDLSTYDVAKDGQRFLVNRYLKPDHVEPLTVVFNATAKTQK